jgi:hypothetical protein
MAKGNPGVTDNLVDIEDLEQDVVDLVIFFRFKISFLISLKGLAINV